MNILFYTFGCTVNKYETQEMRRMFMENGDQIIESGEADAVIINSCAVTSAVENSVDELIKRIKKKHPHTIIALVGCRGALKDKNKYDTAQADIVLDNKKFDIVKAVNKTSRANKLSMPITQSTADTIDSQGKSAVRSYLQIQNGCDNYCTYCIVPYLRGGPVSKSLKDIKNELHGLISHGCKEIVLAGINLGLYEYEGHSLIDILEYIDSFEGLESIRLSSLEPLTLDDGFINKLPYITKLQPHLHISLQSGSDRILSLMNRGYSFESYLSVITRIREKVRNIAVTTDVIVGFPDESEDDFEASCNNIIKCQFSDIHIFKYSKRNGTAAAQMQNQTTAHQKSVRARFLEGIKSQTSYNYNQQFIGSVEKVILTKKHSAELWEGVTAHSIRVFIKPYGMLTDGIYDIEITGVTDDGGALRGVIAKK